MKNHLLSKYAYIYAGIATHSRVNTNSRECVLINNGTNAFAVNRVVLLVVALVFIFNPFVQAAPNLTFIEGIQKSIQFEETAIDGNVYQWGTDNNYGDAARQIVKFSTVPGISPKVYQSTYTELLKPKGSEVTLGPYSYSVIRDMWRLPDGNIIFSTRNGLNTKGYLYKLRTAQDKVGNNPPNFDNKQAIMNIGERNGVQPSDIRTMHQASLSVATIDGATVLFFGEYNVNPSRVSGGNGDWVRLWKSTDLGDTWSKVIEWNTSGHQTSHIHGIRYNPYNKWVYILFGDDGTENGIVAWDGRSPVPPDNTPLNQINNYYPNWKSIASSWTTRTGDIVFTPTHCVWLPDTDVIPPGGLFGQRANHDLSGAEASAEPVPYTEKIPPILGYLDNSNGNIFWSSFRSPDATEQKLYLWTTNDEGSTWNLAAKVDNYLSFPFPSSLFIDYGGELVLSGVLGIAFTPNAGKGGAAYFHINSVPVANPTKASGNKNTRIPVALTGTDVDGVVTQVTIITLPPSAQGILFLADGMTPVVVGVPVNAVQAANLVFVPATNFSGTVTIAFTVTDDKADLSKASANAVITVANIGGNPPVANNDTATTRKGQAVTINVLANDTDPESNIVPGSVTIVAGPINGNAALNADGSVLYTPVPNFVGTDTFTYRVKDATGLVSNLATVTVSVINVNPPVANNDTATTRKGQAVTINVLANDTDPESNIVPGSVTIVAGPTNGNAALNVNGSVLYTPVPNFVGTDTFTYRVKDATGLVSNLATVTVSVINVNPPVANNDTATTRKGQAVTINVLANDTDPESNIVPGSVNIVAGSINGNAALNVNGSVLYTPALNFAGTDSFTYTVKDATGLVSNLATVTVSVITAINDSYNATANTSVTQTINVTAANGVRKNDLPSGVDGRTFAIVENIKRTDDTGHKGSITLNFINSNGSFSYILTAPSTLGASKRRDAKRGIYQFTYTMTLEGVTTLPATVTIQVD